MKATTTSRPYPVTVRHRDLAGEPVPQGGGLEVFDTEAALEINRARLDHLASLELPLEGSGSWTWAPGWAISPSSS